jgi:hypothetical protein
LKKTWQGLHDGKKILNIILLKAFNIEALVSYTLSAPIGCGLPALSTVGDYPSC